MYKIVAKILQPMLLMAIFVFWGVYLIIGAYKGETVFKGLVLIVAISILPGIWALVEHLDSALFSALAPDKGRMDDASDWRLVERMVLDAATTAFYIIFPFIMLYLIAEAGGPRGSQAMDGTERQTSNISKRSGGGAGTSTSGLAKGGTNQYQKIK